MKFTQRRPEETVVLRPSKYGSLLTLSTLGGVELWWQTGARIVEPAKQCQAAIGDSSNAVMWQTALSCSSIAYKAH